jgi:SOS response regulatory protein OraA/RecX
VKNRRWRPQGVSGRPENDDRQPGLPEGEARLLDVRLLAVRQEQDAVTLVLDDGTDLEIAPGSVPEGVPEVGEIIPPGVLEAARLAAERKQVARMVFAMLDRRLQPVARIRDKLVEKGYSMAAVAAVLEQMEAKGLYSDRRYAEAYCRDTLASRAVGRRYLVDKLRGKRVPVAIARTVAAEVLDPATESELAERAAKTRWKKIRGPADRNALAKVVRHLQGRGFHAGDANRAARAMQPRVEDNE